MTLSHRVFVTNDSLSNYIHVWYVAERLWHGHGIPLRMPVLAHGDAYAFPYAFVPWLTAALVRPLLGDWTVTLWLVGGFLGLLAAQWWAFPELRSAWWQALLLLNPMLVEAPLLGQLPFIWATAMLFLAVAAWRRDAPRVAALLAGASQATHPAVMLPIVGPLVLARLWWEPHRARLLVAYAASLVIAAPAVALVLASPAVEDTSTRVLLGNFFGTVSLRAIAVAGPFIALALQRTPLARAPLALFVVLVGLNVVLTPVRRNQYAWRALVRTPDTAARDFTNTQQFVPGATYRVLDAGDGKVSMYRMLQAGAVLDAEPFPESIRYDRFVSRAAYAAFLRHREVDYVMIFARYDAAYRTNEHHLLDEMTAPGDGCAALVTRDARFDVYQVDRARC